MFPLQLFNHLAKMVAPHNTGGDISRSLVRVPGSGYDFSAGSECLNLARASYLAASVPIPSTLPPALVTRKMMTLSPVNQEGITAGILPRKRQLSESSSFLGTNSRAPKRIRIVYMTPQELQDHASRIVPMDTPLGPFLFLTAQPKSETSPSPSPSTTLSDLIKQRDNLRQENQELQRRLILFQQLFKDKKRLTSVVKRLGVNVP